MRRQRAGGERSAAIRHPCFQGVRLRRRHHRMAGPPDADRERAARSGGPAPMNTPSPPFLRWVRLAARVVLGGVFLYLGLTKALDPVGFLKLLRQFDLLPGPLLLNTVAAV